MLSMSAIAAAFIISIALGFGIKHWGEVIEVQRVECEKADGFSFININESWYCLKGYKV